MSLRLATAGKADIPKLVDLYFTTFKSPLVLRVKPNIPPVRAWYQKSLESDFQTPYTQIYTVMDGSEIIAFAKWSAPHAEAPPEGPAEYPVDGDAVLFEDVVGKASATRKKILGDEEHWYLAVLATLPKHQRRGAGSLLMTEFCEQVDRSGQRAYVEASPLGKSTYERFGFEERDAFSCVIDGEPYVDCCMVREPRESS